MTSASFRSFVLLFSGLGWVATAAAQTTGTIRGDARDTTGSPLPGVTVTVTSESRGTSRSTQTGGSGSFVLPTLPVDTYTVEARLDGFLDRKVGGMRVGIGSTTELELVLPPDSVEDTITVSSAPILDTTSSSVDTSFTAELLEDLPTDRYMAVEGANGLIAAIADAHSLEAAGNKILRPLMNGTLGSDENPYEGFIALDGNLTQRLLEQIAVSPAFSKADLRVAPASPGKAERLLPFLVHDRATLYVNLEEAGLLCQREFTSSEEAAAGLLDRGARRALVTDGGNSASDATPDSIITQVPPSVMVTRVTGAGDTFMAAHIASEKDGSNRDDSLNRALRAAATYVSGGSPK